MPKPSAVAPWDSEYVIAISSASDGTATAVHHSGAPATDSDIGFPPHLRVNDAQWKQGTLTSVRLPAHTFLPLGGEPNGGSVEDGLPSLHDLFYDNRWYSKDRLPPEAQHVPWNWPPSQRFVVPPHVKPTHAGAPNAAKSAEWSQLALAHYRGVGPRSTPARLEELSAPMTQSMLWELAMAKAAWWCPSATARIRGVDGLSVPLPVVRGTLSNSPRGAVGAAAVNSTLAVAFRVLRRRRDEFVREFDERNDPLAERGRGRITRYVYAAAPHDARGVTAADASEDEMLYPVGLLLARPDAADPRGAHVDFFYSHAAEYEGGRAGAALLHTFMTLVQDGRLRMVSPWPSNALPRCVLSAAPPPYMLTYFVAFGLRFCEGCDEEPLELSAPLRVAYDNGALPRCTDALPSGALVDFLRLLRARSLGDDSRGYAMRYCLSAAADVTRRVPYDPPHPPSSAARAAARAATTAAAAAARRASSSSEGSSTKPMQAYGADEPTQHPAHSSQDGGNQAKPRPPPRQRVVNELGELEQREKELEAAQDALQDRDICWTSLSFSRQHSSS